MKKFSAEMEQRLLDDGANPVERANAIICMRADGLECHEALLVALLNHPSPHLRAEALRALLGWGREQWVPLALKWLAGDRDEHVRSFVAFDLAYAATRFPVHERAIVEALVRVLEHDASEFVAAKANSALQFLLVPGAQFLEIPNDDFDRHRDVDWELLKPFRSATR
jgi:HEAT repeat protein